MNTARIPGSCPIAYDHPEVEDAEGTCAVCGWSAAESPVMTPHPDDMPTETGPDRIRKAIAIDRGGYAPKVPIVLCNRAEGDPR